MRECPWCKEIPKVVDKSGVVVFVCPEESKCIGSGLCTVFFGTVEDAVIAWDNRKE